MGDEIGGMLMRKQLPLRMEHSKCIVIANGKVRLKRR